MKNWSYHLAKDLKWLELSRPLLNWLFLSRKAYDTSFKFQLLVCPFQYHTCSNEIHIQVWMLYLEMEQPKNWHVISDLLMQIMLSFDGNKIIGSCCKLKSTSSWSYRTVFCDPCIEESDRKKESQSILQMNTKSYICWSHALRLHTHIHTLISFIF